MDGKLTKRIKSRKARLAWSLGFFFSILIGVGAPTEASEACRPKDYNAQPNSPLRKIPVYDQAETGICYAYAAAQMIDFYRFSHGEATSDLTNPVYAAFASAFSKNGSGKESLYGGFPGEVITSLRRSGTCPNSEVQKNLSSFKADLQVSDAQVLAFLEESSRIGRLVFPSVGDALAQAAKAIPSLGTCELRHMAMESAAQGYLGLSAKVIFEDAFKSCQAMLKPVNVPPTETHNAGSDSALRAELDRALERNPVTIGVCSKFFDDPQYQGLKGLMAPYVRNADVNVKPDCKGHGVMVTGRREVGGRCQYLIRNSWGASWRAPGAKGCACIDQSGRYWENCTQPENVKEYVGCWFDADSMIRNTTEVTAFK